MANTSISQLKDNNFLMHSKGVEKRLEYIGNNIWLLSIGENKLKNFRDGSFKSIRFNNLREVELEYPEWKGISLMCSSEKEHNKPYPSHSIARTMS